MPPRRLLALAITPLAAMLALAGAAATAPPPPPAATAPAPAADADAAKDDDADSNSDDDREGLFSFLNEQLILLATIVGSIAALPTLIEFLVDRRKRRERIALSLDDVEVAELRPALAGMDDLLEDVADLIDRARRPQAYPDLAVGNEVLIIGPSLSGKKTLAQRLAVEAKLDRVITVYNPRNADALAKAKSLVHAYRRQKVMLLLPRVDSAFEQEDEDLLAELEALIETTSGRSNVLVVGTAATLVPDSPLDNSFGIKLVLPGTRRAAAKDRQLPEDVRRLLTQVVRFYHRQAADAGFRLEAMDLEYLEARILDSASNPAEIEDILSMCRTLALFERNRGGSASLGITPEMLETAIARVIVPAVPGDDDDDARVGKLDDDDYDAIPPPS